MMPEARFPRPPANDRLNVILLSDYGSINGGQAKIAIESALSLRRRGLNICFIAGCGPLDERLERAGIECHVVGDHDILSDPNRARAALSGIWNRNAARVVAECIAARDPAATVIHMHGWAKALSPSIGPVITRSAAAHVVTLHEYFLACPNGGFFDYPAQAICTRRPLGAACLTTNCDSRSVAHKSWRVARHVALRAISRMPQELREIIYLAPEQIDIVGLYTSDEARWHYLPNPVGVTPESRIAAEHNDIFLFVGRLSPEKGAPVAAAAARQAGCKIVFCGDGEERDAILRANPDAIITGWVGEDQVAGWMRRARALLFPSLWYECYPLVVADALRAGLPVLTSANSVARSSIKHGVDGLHIPAGDVAAWSAAMVTLGSDALVRRYSEAAFAAGRELLDEADYISRLISIYDLVLLRRRGLPLPAKDAVSC